MNTAQWQRVRQVFDRVVDSDPPERPGLLSELTGDDDEVRREVETLLAALEADEDRIEHERTALGRRMERVSDDPLERAGREIGPYRLIRRVGRGGMGDVYLAERVDGQFDRRVAIKLIRPGMDSEAVIERFRRERQILAGLSHPAIAPLLDGGVTAEGLPYLVMEYLEGLQITARCEQDDLPVDERIRLFREVCAAVHFAHQNLVIHRDLKPSNILVMPDGTVRLLDFGVAKLLQADGEGLATLTQFANRGFTPSYASPEQIRGELVTTATDVYSLGVVLYELLTGRLPYDLQGESLGELIRAVETLEPTRPSRALPEPSATRSATLRRKLSGDLDNIILMAIEKDPARRYASVHDLSEDLRRFLEGHPVVARADTLPYRAGKFLRRNRAAVAASVVIAGLVVAGTWGTLSQSHRASVELARAEQRVQDLRDLTYTLIFEVHDAVADLPGATEARRLILDRGFANLEQLATEIEDDVLQREIADAYLRLGMVQGQPTGASLGNLEDAQRSYSRAIEIAERLTAAHPDDWQVRRTLALAHEKTGDALAWSGTVEEGVRHAARALELYRSIADAHPDSARHRMSTAISLVKLGDLTGHPIFPNLNRPDESLLHYETARSILDSPPLAASPEWGVRRYRALTDERIGMMHRLAGRWTEARAAFTMSLNERARLAAENPSNLDARRDVAVTRQQLCEVESASDQQAHALVLCGEALAIYEELYAADEHNAQAQVDVALGSLSMAGVQATAGDPPAALRTLERAIDVLQQAAASEPTNTPNRRFLGRALARHTLIAWGSGRPAPFAREARATLVGLVEQNAAEADDHALLRSLQAGPQTN